MRIVIDLSVELTEAEKPIFSNLLSLVSTTRPALLQESISETVKVKKPAKAKAKPAPAEDAVLEAPEIEVEPVIEPEPVPVDLEEDDRNVVIEAVRELGIQLSNLGKYALVTDSLAAIGAVNLSAVPTSLLIQFRNEWASILEAAKNG
jgi:DNA replication initiation complex subunit (GINS family)